MRRAFLLLSTCLTLVACQQRPRSSDGGAGPSCITTPMPAATARLLNRREYARTVVDLLGVPQTDVETIVAGFPREPRVEGFDNNAISHIANPLLVEQLSSAASRVAELARLNGFVTAPGCSMPGRDCATQFVGELGKHAFRRSLSAGESGTFMQLYDAVAPVLGHDAALASIVEAMLLSPQFLYRIESPLTAQDSENGAGMVPLGSYELAARLSYFLWGSQPDAELLASAESGALIHPDVLEAQARRMLEHPLARLQVRDFHAAWLGLDAISGLVRDGAPPEAMAALEESVLAFTDSIFWSPEGSVADLLSSPLVFTNQYTGGFYGGPTGDQMLAFSAPRRSGLLTQPGLLTLLAHPDQSSPIRRGVFVREQILCDDVPAPPANVDNSPPDPDPNLTTRERFRVHTEQPSCAGCHQLIDPVGFTFEEYDHLGRQREQESGAMIDTSGGLIASPDPALDGDLTDASDLGRRLAHSPVVTRCITKKWFTFALGRPSTDADNCVLEQVVQRVDADGGHLKDILLRLVMTELFRARATNPEVVTQ